MRTPLHALASVAAASLLPGVVSASQRGDVAPWLAAVLGGMLPDALEALSRALAKADILFTPDPSAAPETTAAEAARAVALAANRALATGRPTRLRLRPLPSSVGTLELRLQNARCTARIESSPSTSPSCCCTLAVAPSFAPSCCRTPAVTPRPSRTAAHASVRIPAAPPLWPATVAISAPDGALLEFHPTPNSRHLAEAEQSPVAHNSMSLSRIEVRAPGRGRGLAHSALLLGTTAAVLFAIGGPVCAAAAAALLAHGMLDALGMQGIPLWRRGGARLALRRCADTAAATERAVAIVSCGVLAFGLVLRTAYLEHERRLFAVVLVLVAAAALSRRHSQASARSVPAAPYSRPSGTAHSAPDSRPSGTSAHSA